jgi:hypothetical protein
MKGKVIIDRFLSSVQDILNNTAIEGEDKAQAMTMAFKTYLGSLEVGVLIWPGRYEKRLVFPLLWCTGMD